MNLTPNLTGHATAPAGSINLAPYPGLVYAPGQHGEGIRFAHNGKPVEDLRDKYLSGPDYVNEGGIGDMIAHAAEQLGVSFADVCDALKYLRDAKQI
jgi:hypothetical protein